MAHKDDFIRLNLKYFGEINISVDKTEFSWPPPEFIVMDDDSNDLREATKDDHRDIIFQRISMSQITDEQIEQCPNVARGANYKYVDGNFSGMNS